MCLFVIVAHISIQRVLAPRMEILFYFCRHVMVRHISIQRVLAPRMAICIFDSVICNSGTYFHSTGARSANGDMMF